MRLLLLIFIVITSETGLLSGQGTEPTDGPDEDTKLEIFTKDHLLYLSKNSSADWSADYEQTANISFSSGDFESGGDFYNNGHGFSPIGNSTTRFTGSYDGHGHTISGLFIDWGVEYIGLFGYVHTAAIQNLGIIDVTITGHESVGALVGMAYLSTIMDCYSTGNIIFYQHGGGLVGELVAGNMYRCYSSASLSGIKRTGGLVGCNSGNIYRCFSTGYVQSGDEGGGLVGISAGNDNSISNCYSHAHVDRPGWSYASNIGGLCGNNIYGSTISTCYATGSVTYEGASNPTDKGLVGNDDSGIYDSNFFDSQTSGQSTSPGATGKTTSEMKNHDTFTDETTAGLATAWDFESNPNCDAANNDYWDMDYSRMINNGYPYLSWQDGVDVSLPVELTSFYCYCENRTVILEWITESEVNNFGFILERKTADTDWQTIASYQNDPELIGRGNTSSRTEYQFTDKYVLPGEIYTYRLSEVDNQGNVTVDDVISISLDCLPEFTGLLPAFPNPFNSQTRIQYTLSENADVTLSVVDMRGRTVQTLIKERQHSAGNYSVNWNGTDASSRMASSGIYLLILKAGEIRITQKVMLLK